MDNGITWIETEVVKGSRRTVAARALRTSIAKMKLDGNQEQARSDLSIAYADEYRGYGYCLLGHKTANLTGSRGAGLSEDAIDAIRKRLGKLYQWEMLTAEKLGRGPVYSVKALEKYGHTARSYASLVDRSTSTITRWYKAGLDEYIDLYF